MRSTTCVHVFQVVQLLALLQVISNRNHMVFTPLLASTCVGTLEGRSVAVHIHGE